MTAEMDYIRVAESLGPGNQVPTICVTNDGVRKKILVPNIRLYKFCE